MKNKFLIATIVLSAVVLVFHYGGGYDRLFAYLEQEPVIIERHIDTAKPKIEQMKWDIVDEIAECESGGIPKGQRNSIVIMDTNGYYSRGKWKFQLRTVQYYVEKFEGKQITLDEATLIAHSEEKARNLAYRIVWDEVGGVWNWTNCAKKLGLRSKIEIIRKLDK